MVKRLPTMRETQVKSLGQEDLLEKEMAAHSSILAWKIPWTENLLEKEMATHPRILAWKIPWMEKPGRLQSMGSQRVGHD